MSKSNIYDDGNENPDADRPEQPNLPYNRRTTLMKSFRKIDFLKDQMSQMTPSRRIALRLMEKRWYFNPEVDSYKPETISSNEIDDDSSEKKESKAQQPSLAKAWAYFEHVTLPRYILLPETDDATDNKNKKNQLMCSMPGENVFQTELYSTIKTPLNQMGDFGLGVGLYFSMLRFMAIIIFIAGLISIPNIIFYSSKDYTDHDNTSYLDDFLRGSAICNNDSWVPCPNCTEAMFSRDKRRFGSTSSGLIFALKNHCDGAILRQGVTNYVAMLFLVVGIVVMNYLQVKKEVEFDEDEQTAQDYSLVVSNPPMDAYDPEEWKTFFSQFGHVTCCTVTLRNNQLLHLLADRRKVFKHLQDKFPFRTELNENDLTNEAEETIGRKSNALKVAHALLQPIGLCLDVPALYSRLAVYNMRVRKLSRLKAPVSKVFITFETECAQRKALVKLSVGSFYVMRNNSRALSSKDFLFQGQLVLDVGEPAEPDAILWEDLTQTLMALMKRIMITTFTCILSLVLIVHIVSFLRKKSVVFSSFTIAGLNVVFPHFAKAMTSLEPHPNAGSRQGSLYTKIAVFRWVITAIILSIIIPFTSTLSSTKNDLIKGVNTIFFAEIVSSTIIQLLDPVGHFKRHFLAPRAKTQESMNKCFEGTNYELAERYTSATKLIFLAFFYNSIYPAIFFLAAFALFINYMVDKFSIMRTWKRAPKIGKEVSEFSRKYFLSTAVIALVVVSSYFWSGFPYDNLCEQSTIAWNGTNTNYIGDHVMKLKPHHPPHLNKREVVIFEGDNVYQFCNQNLWSKPGAFPALPRHQTEGYEWMTDDQEFVTSLFGWTSIAIAVLVMLSFVFQIFMSIKSLFRSSYKSVGDDQLINYSTLDAVDAYIPQIKSPVYTYPLIACDLTRDDEVLLSWTDPDRDYDYYQLSKDVRKILGPKEEFNHHFAFSSFTYWPDINDNSEEE